MGTLIVQGTSYTVPYNFANLGDFKLKLKRFSAALVGTSTANTNLVLQLKTAAGTFTVLSATTSSTNTTVLMLVDFFNDNSLGSSAGFSALYGDGIVLQYGDSLTMYGTNSSSVSWTMLLEQVIG